MALNSLCERNRETRSAFTAEVLVCRAPSRTAGLAGDKAYPDADVVEKRKDFAVLKRISSDKLPSDRTVAQMILSACCDSHDHVMVPAASRSTFRDRFARGGRLCSRQLAHKSPECRDRQLIPHRNRHPDKKAPYFFSKPEEGRHIGSAFVVPSELATTGFPIPLTFGGGVV